MAVKRLTPDTPGVLRSRAIWKHNGHRGQAVWIRRAMEGIEQSETATDETKMIARKMLALSADLHDSLAKRKGEE